MYTPVSDLFKIVNLFPPDVTPAARFLLCLLHLSGPVSQTALKMILKPLICDDNVAPMIQSLIDGGYLHSRNTYQSRFYALSPRTEAYIDYRDETTHRRQSIADKNLLTYRLQSGIMAEKLATVAAKQYLAAWDKQTADQKEAYLTKKYNQYNLKDYIDYQAFCTAFTEEIQRATVKTIDLLPRSIVTQEEVLEALAKSVLAGKILFTDHYNKAIYHSGSGEFLKKMLAYDTAQSYKMALSAKRQAAQVKMDTDPQAAKDYIKLNDELDKVCKSIEDLKHDIELFTYRHKEKVLSLRVLEQNGIFLRGQRDGVLFFGLLNNSADGLHGGTLDVRLDYIVTFADKLGKPPRVTLYSTPGSTEKTTKRLAILTASMKSASRYAIPEVSYRNIPCTVKPKFEVWHDFTDYLTASNIPTE